MSDSLRSSREERTDEGKFSSPGTSPSSGSPHDSDYGNQPLRNASPATSSDAPAPGSDLKVDTRAAVHCHRDTSRSPHLSDGSELRRPPARVGGLALSTMHEESDQVDLNPPRNVPLSAGPDLSFGPGGNPALRPSRYRSASSAAALALHGSGSSFADRWSSSATGRIASAVPSRALWGERESTGAGVGSSNVPQRPFPPLQRGFSASYVRTQHESTSPTPFLSSPVNFNDSSFDFAAGLPQSASRSSFHSAASPFGPPTDLPELSSYPGLDSHAAAQHDGSISESRRHSLAAGPGQDATGVIGGHRRSIGFNVEAPSSNGFGNSHRTDSRRRGFNPFAGGSLALSADDLASDFDFEPLANELSRARMEQDREQQHQPASSVHVRVPSETAADTGTHAASMPSGHGEGGIDAFKSGSIDRSGAYRPPGALNRNGLESLSASWDVLTPSQQMGRSPQEAQVSLAEMTRQLRQMSIGADGGIGAFRSRTGGPSALDDARHMEGTETVRASPGVSPSGRFALSAHAKSFNLSQPSFAANQDAMLASMNAGRHQPFVGTGPGMPLGPMPSVLQRQHPTLPPQPSFGLPAIPQMADLAFSSLAALGPMPPSSMGPPGPMHFGSGPQGELQDLGKGVPLSSLPKDTPLYIVEFKQGRTDLFFRSTTPSSSPNKRPQEQIQRGDLVIVEADRGKDLGTVVNDNITVEQVQAFLAHQSDLTIGAAGALAGMRSTESAVSSAGDSTSSPAPPSGLSTSPSSSTGGAGTDSASRPMRTINPKRLFTKATPADTSSLYSKAMDEERALQLCVTKVMQRELPMTVVAAEMQWDRRKLTFYYTASMRVDFRDLVKELFRLYKTRIWMCHLGHPSGTGMG